MTIAPGQTQSLLFIGGLGHFLSGPPGANTVAGAVADAQLFNDVNNVLPGGPLADVLSGISPAELATIVNWNFSSCLLELQPLLGSCTAN